MAQKVVQVEAAKAQSTASKEQDEVVQGANPLSGPGARIQIQGLDAPAPAVHSEDKVDGNLDIVNGLPLTEEQQKASEADHYVIDEYGQAVKKHAS